MNHDEQCELWKQHPGSHPTIESIIHIAGVYNDCNYFEEGRTLGKMGLDNMSIDEIGEYLQTLRQRAA